jgi:putative tryptophan/tyrosine transport system substrate-binding protein
MLGMRRRAFITLLGGAATAWPLAARAQQPAMPVVGYLDAGSASERAYIVAAFRQGLADAGYIEGQNVAIEYRWAEGDYTRLSEMAADLVRRQVSLIVTPGAAAGAQAAKNATSTIPIVFAVGQDPVKLGLVESLARPGGNATGVNIFNNELVAKRMGLLRELSPTAARVAVLVNPSDVISDLMVRDAQAAASVAGLGIVVLTASTPREIDAAFASLVQDRADALFVGPGAFFNARRVQLVGLAAHHRIPSTYSARAYAEAGGLMTYGTNQADMFRQVGSYAGRVLKGAKPADLPVVQSIKFELVINLNTARALGLTVPPSLLARADEVIE